jgi:hypothetical protein
MEGLDESLLAAEGMVSAESEGRKDEPNRVCLNCSTPLTDLYCAHCGQKDIPRRQTLGELAFNFLSSFSGYESKFFQTCRYLLIKPGFLAEEYNAGKRERYFHPARMYVFISFIYFLLFTSLPESNQQRSVINIPTDKENIDFNMGGDKDENDDYEDFKSRAEYDSLQKLLPAEERDGWFMRKWNYRRIDLWKQFKADPPAFASKVVEEFRAHFSQIFFALLPVFAFILWLLYLRKDFFYHEHLVFSIWCYNFFFLVGSFVLITESVPDLTWLGSMLKFAVIAYLLFAMKRCYKQSWGKTVLKFTVFLVAFGICILFGLFTNLVITLMLI